MSRDDTTHPTVGIVALGRPTFDLELARSNVQAAMERLRGRPVRGSSEVVTDAEGVTEAVERLGEGIELLLVLQATFSDATMIDAAARAWPGPIAIWGFPEERTGGRLRLNSFCGMNLAAYRLRSLGRTARYRYASPEETTGLADLFDATPVAPGVASSEASPRTGEPGAAADRLRASRIGVVGEPPDGFYPCAGEADEIRRIFGTELTRIPLARMFETASTASEVAVASSVAGFTEMRHLGDLPPEEVEGTARLGSALRSLRDTEGLDAIAVRCWPECFTDFGAAACASIGRLNDDGIPATCEADVYGCLTGLVLGAITDEPNVSVDLVDPERASNTVVLWHCGHLPPSMAGGEVAAVPHPNRGVGVLGEFALRPGRVTIARVTRAGGSHGVAVGGGEILDTDRPFSGTCGVMRPDTDVDRVIETVLGSGLDHHLGLVYGDHREAVRGFARELALPVIEL